MADEFIDNLVALPDVYHSFSFPVDISLLDTFRCDPDAPPLPEAEGFLHVPEDAFFDAADGELSSSPIAAGEVNSALRTPVSFDDDGVATVSVVVAAGEDLGAARASLAAYPDPRHVASAAEEALSGWIAGFALPSSAPEPVQKVARRSLINLRVGTDAATGAVVASIARQAPYGLDWPRDGAFFNVALDVSGQTELVARRAELYDQWQRKDPVRPTPLVDIPPPPTPGGPTGTYPAGAWEMNYYADGLVGGTWRFEIDNTGFAVWSIVAHAGWEDDPAAYLRSRWDAISRGADLLTRWRDPDTGLHWPAQEGDNSEYTQTLHGAVTTFGALDIASRATRLLGEDAQAIAWEDRAAELRDAILTHLYDDDEGRFVSSPAAIHNPGSTATGPTAWFVWPMRLLPWDDDRVSRQLEIDLDAIEAPIRLETDGGAYFMKNTVSLALARGEDPMLGPHIAELRDLPAGHATAGTDHFGEVMVVVEEEGMRRADQRVSTPHLWEGTLFYLTAMALEDPSLLVRYDDVLPPSRVPAPFTRDTPAPASGGCCAVASTRGNDRTSHWGASMLVLLSAALGLRGRRRVIGGAGARR